MPQQDYAVSVTEAWHETFPRAHVGLLAMDGVLNPPTDESLQHHVTDLETRLRERFNGANRSTLTSLPVIAAYTRHYRAFGQTYHVLRQLESVALRGKSLSSRGALVLAMFAIELETQLLTAGHDLDAVEPPLVLDRSSSEDRFIGIGGQEFVLRPGDMLMHDSAGIISAVIYGPDQRTRLNENTRRVMFTTYAPEGITVEDLRGHLEKIPELVRLVAPTATIMLMDVYP